MIERGQRARFTFESQDRLPVAGDVRSENLDRHVAAEAGVAGAIHLTHAAGSEQTDDFVAANTGSGLKGQRLEL